MKKIIVLTNPIEGFWKNLSKGVHLPLSLLSTAVFLDKAYDIIIIDQRVDKGWENRLRAALELKPVFAGVTSMTGSQIKNALQISRIIKEYGVTCVWGGVHASLMPEQTLKNPYVDIVIKGEGEMAALELAKALETNSDLSGIAGVCYKKDSRIICNPDREFADLNLLPDVPYHLVDMGRYHYKFEGKWFINFVSSRGCPHRCRFCYNTVFNKRRWRAMNPETVIGRLKALKDKYKIEGVWLRDDNFFVDKSRAITIMKGLKELGLPWGTSGARLDMFDSDIADALNDSDCRFLFIGVESGSNKLLKLIGKDITKERIIEVNKNILSRINAVQRMNIMIGLPGETIEDIRQTVDLGYQILKDNKNAILSNFLIYTPYPGTELYNQEGKPETLEGWQNYRLEVCNLPFKQEHKRILRMLAFATWFMDGKLQIYGGSWLIRLLAKLYQPIANYRIKNLYAGFPAEIRLAEAIGF